MIEEFRNQLSQYGLDLHETLAELHEGGFLNFNDLFLEQSTLQRIMLAEHLIRRGRDPQLISSLLLWQEFEDFIETALSRNAYHAVKRFVFKSRLGRREIDILAWNEMWILVIDCKHWSRNLTKSRMRHVAAAQAQRANALAGRPELLQNEGVARLDLPMVPVILSLVESSDQIVKGVPIVAVSKFASFLHEFSPYDAALKTFTIRREPTQRSLQLFGEPKA
jgi:Holliday junction resolvase-like predicted endonuclease